MSPSELELPAVHAVEILDSRGNPTLEPRVALPQSESWVRCWTICELVGGKRRRWFVCHPHCCIWVPIWWAPLAPDQFIPTPAGVILPPTRTCVRSRSTSTVLPSQTSPISVVTTRRT